MEHSKTPWKIGAMESGQAAIDSADGKEVTGFIDMEDARRILACVNAMAGIDDDNVLFRRGSVGTVRKHIVTQQVQIEKLTAQRDKLQQQLATERASLFAESQRKQQLEQQVEELVGVLEAMLEEVTGCYCTTEAAARAVIQKVRGGE